MIGNVRKKFWFAILSVLCCTLFVVPGRQASAQMPKTGRLVVKITGIRNSDGNIRVALRRDQSTIVDAKIVEIDPKTLTAEAVFDNVAEGDCGVAVIHDENKNGKLDFNEMGVPTEGYGHSNNPEKRPGPPDFSETKFAFAAPGTTIEIKLVYWM